jgi:hypothetical protein
MRIRLILAALLALGATTVAETGFVQPAAARPGGCVKGAIVGGVAGHLAHHGMLGAAAGCAYGLHKRHAFDNPQSGRSAATPDRR